MAGTKNRAFEGEDEEISNDKQEGHNGKDIGFSRKIFPHGIHGPDISKFVNYAYENFKS